VFSTGDRKHEHVRLVTGLQQVRLIEYIANSWQLIPVLWIDCNADRTVQFGGENVIENVLCSESCYSNPVVQCISPVDTSRQPVYRHAVHLSRHSRVDRVHWYVVSEWHSRRLLLAIKHTTPKLFIATNSDQYSIYNVSQKIPVFADFPDIDWNLNTKYYTFNHAVFSSYTYVPKKLLVTSTSS